MTIGRCEHSHQVEEELIEEEEEKKKKKKRRERRIHVIAEMPVAGGFIYFENVKVALTIYEQPFVSHKSVGP